MHSSPDVPSPHASPVSPAAHRPAPPGSRGTLLAIGACCALSGFSALLYLSAWTRQFTFVFGTSGLAVATVLAACMGGLAVGAWLVERYLDRVRKPVFVFGVLQFVAGIAAIAVPVLLLGTESLLVAVLGAQPGPPESTGGMTTALYLATSFLVVVIPTACMGATLPLLTRHVVRTRDQIGSRIGLLYATNTLGAVVGALAAGFLLFPNAGLYETLVVGAIVSVLAFAMAALIARSELRSGQHPPAWADDERSSRSRMPWRQRLAPGPGWILPLTLVSGAACFGYAVLWTRMLSHVIGASVHALAVMLASFLLGIALGSLASMPFTRSRTLAQSAFVVTQVAIAAVAAGVYWSLDAILPAGTDLAASIGVALIALLPAAIFMGATFPLAARILADDAEFAAAETARLYAWNTFGVAAGVLLAGLVIIPALRFEGAIQVLVVTNIALALVTALLFANPRLAWSAATAVLLGLAVLLLRPPVPDRLLAASPLDSSAQGAMRHYGVGQSASAVVFEHEGSLLLRTNGLPEANIDISGTPPRFRGDAWLSPLACIARPATKNMLVVGYGGGAAVDGVPPSVQSIDVIEPEPQVLAANAAVRTLRARDPLLDPRVNVIENDVHAALALTSRRYDAIVSQPSHPWSAGEAHLYTREFLHDARAHLAPGGVFVQSIGLGFIDEEMLRSLAATMLDVFPHVRIYRPDPDTLVFLGSPQPLDVEREMARRQDRPISQYPSHYARFGIHAHEDLLAALVADRDGAAALARGAPLVTGNHNRLASAGVHDRRVLSAATASRILTQYDPLQRRDTWVFNSPDFAVAVDYLARRIALFEARDPGVARRLQRLAGLTPGAAQQAYVAAISRRVAGDIQGSLRLLQESVALDPGFAAARFELLRGWLAALARGDAPAEVATMAEALTGSAAAVIEAARYANGGDWQKIPPLDPVLRTATWTDAWYLEAVQVRVEWRTRVTVAQMRARLGREALAILDEALVVQPVSPGLLALRAQAARSADEPEILMESLQEFAKGTVALSDQQRARQGAAPARDTAQAARMFDVLLEMLDGIADDKRIRAERHAAVRASVLRAREHVTQANREG
jgi:spermidine synthase